MTTSPWWRNAIFYEIYVRSFADADGDGIGDLPGVTSRLPYLAELGVDAIWLTPFYRSPQADHGYDVSDYRDVDPMFGDLADFDTMLRRAHDLGIKVVVDIVPNHTSDEHEWFKAALAAGPGSLERERYIFRPGTGRHGTRPPNNWRSVFGGPAWKRLEDGDWYLHLFDEGQPDLNWRNPEVGDEFESVLRFWLDRGVDGFRIDVAHGMFKPEDLSPATRQHRHPYYDNPEVHDVYRRWHTILAEYDGDRMAVAEAWVDDAASMARYVRADELQQAFNFHWLKADWSAAAFRRVITDTLAAVEPVQASPTWVLSNHDVTRHVTRYGGGARGVARARAATLTMLALPGSAYFYMGEELGLPQADVGPAQRQDPTWLRGGGVGRDGARVPLPWSGDRPPYGFGQGSGSACWLPQPADWSRLTVEAEDADAGSTLTFYRRAVHLRRGLASTLGDEFAFLDIGPGLLAFSRGPGFVCVINCGSRRRRLPPVGDLLISSGDDHDAGHGWLAPNTAAWFAGVE